MLPRDTLDPSSCVIKHRMWVSLEDSTETFDEACLAKLCGFLGFGACLGAGAGALPLGSADAAAGKQPYCCFCVGLRAFLINNM